MSPTRPPAPVLPAPRGGALPRWGRLAPLFGAALAALPGCLVTEMGCGDPACAKPSGDGPALDEIDSGGALLGDLDSGAPDAPISWSVTPAQGPAGALVAVGLAPSGPPPSAAVGARASGGAVVCGAEPAGDGLTLALGLPADAAPGAIDLWVRLADGDELHLPAAFDVQPGGGGLVAGDPCAAG